MRDFWNDSSTKRTPQNRSHDVTHVWLWEELSAESTMKTGNLKLALSAQMHDVQWVIKTGRSQRYVPDDESRVVDLSKSTFTV